MSDFVALLHNKVFWIVVGSYYVFAAAVVALPAPDQKAGMFYRFLYGFAHALSANADKVAKAVKLPGTTDEAPKP